MKKRAGAGFVLSVLLPFAALAVAMTRVFEGRSRAVALTLYGLGWVALLFALRRHRRSLVAVERGRRRVAGALARHGRPVLAVTALLVCGFVVLTLVPVDDAPFLRMSDDQVRARIDQDLASVERWLAGQARFLAVHEPVLRGGGGRLGPEEREGLVQAWASYLDYAVALDRLVDVHRFFYQIDPIAHRDLNARSFLVGYAALAGQMRNAAALRAAIADDPPIESVLDDPREELGIDADAYTRLRRHLIDPRNLVRLHVGRAHLGMLEATGAVAGDREAALAANAKRAYGDVWRQVGEEPGVLADNPLDDLESRAFVAWFPLQKGVAETMGNLRTTARENFVRVAQLQAVLPELEPGDILLERRNWYLTNVGLPGFWPHAALYTGTLEELDAYFAGTDLAATGGLAPSQYVARRAPDLFAAFEAPDEDGHDRRVIEAIGEGVTLTSLEHSGNADYLAVVRPRVPRADKLAALVRAFSFHGRPYDFDFDFFTDASVVCSELVYKAYESVDGLSFGLVRTGGRAVLRPNDIARKFDEERTGAPGAGDPELDFVLFLDGSEQRGRAVARDAEAFRSTWRRPKWDLAQP